MTNEATPMPAPLFAAILELIQRDVVRSVSCSIRDHALWQALVAEQSRRSERSGLPRQEAFWLGCDDGGLGDIPVEAWGGEMHVPYEGICGSDLFVLPKWHGFLAEKIRHGGKLSWAIHKRCNHVLMHGDFGELACATRTVIGDWTLYTSTAPHEDCNPEREWASDLAKISNSQIVPK
jgi:hypothetical protein